MRTDRSAARTNGACTIRIGVDGDALESFVAAGADDTQRDLAAIRDEYAPWGQRHREQAGMAGGVNASVVTNSVLHSA